MTGMKSALDQEFFTTIFDYQPALTDNVEQIYYLDPHRKSDMRAKQHDCG